MKLLSVAIPCYNSAAYMRNCIESLLPGGDEVEILIVDDGSTKDNTAEIADEYERNYPGICRAIHQENGGHGEAVNAGLRNATGVYYKVVDSDDWVNEEAYMEVLDTLRKFVHDNVTLDMLITNFVYEKQGAKHKKVMNYNMALPKRQLIDWNGARGFRLGQYILMHSVIYRVEMLRNCGLELPKHTFYVDNIFVYQPLPHVKSMYYLDVNFYRYFIGRDDQSVNEKVMISRIDQQILVTKLMLGYYDVSGFGGYVNYKATEHFGILVGGQAVERHGPRNYYEVEPIATPYVNIGRGKKKVGIGLPVGQIIYGLFGR